MLIAFWLLLFLYIGLTLLYAITKTEETKIPPWPVLTNAYKQDSVESACQSHSDCPSTHVCLGNQCIPKLLKVNDCNPETGQWISYIYRGVTFAICVCLKPHLVNQKYFGGNCDVNVGCGVHGHYLPDKNICECDPGYKEVGLTCQKVPAIDNLNLDPCGVDEIKVTDIKQSDGFHKDYVSVLCLSPLKCVKRPCTFDALSGRPLKHAKYVEGYGCVCDPRYGLFGVVLDGEDKAYLNSPGFDACASIYSKDPKDPVNVKLIKYFYLGKREPVSIIHFSNLNEEDIVTPLKGTTDIMMTQQRWQYDYAQYFFDTNPEFRARTRHAPSVQFFNIEQTNEWYYSDYFSPARCNDIPFFWLNRRNPRSDAYDLLYKSPVCRVGFNDPDADPMFWNKVIVNPQHLTFKDFAHLHRFNAFVLDYDANVGARRWTLDLDSEYKIDTYQSIDTNAPKYKVITKNRPIMP